MTVICLYAINTESKKNTKEGERMRRFALSIIFFVFVSVAGLNAANSQYISYTGEKTILEYDKQILLALMWGTSENCSGFSQREYSAVSKSMDRFLGLMGEGPARLAPLYADRYARRILRLANANRALFVKCQSNKCECGDCKDYNSKNLVLLVLYDKIFQLQGGAKGRYKSWLSPEVKKEIADNVGRELYQQTYTQLVYHEIK